MGKQKWYVAYIMHIAKLMPNSLNQKKRAEHTFRPYCKSIKFSAKDQKGAASHHQHEETTNRQLNAHFI